MEAMESWGQDGIVLDLDRLERQAEDLRLDHFVEAIRETRDRLGRYLVVRLEEVDGDGAMSETADSLAELVAPRTRTCSGPNR
jgi:hypothetical protein